MIVSVQFSLASWWRFGWDVTLDSDDSFRRARSERSGRVPEAPGEPS